MIKNKRYGLLIIVACIGLFQTFACQKSDPQPYLTVNLNDVGADIYPFNADQFFIFNVAVGGNWPGPPDYTTVFPQRMFVDYVRVFQ